MDETALENGAQKLMALISPSQGPVTGREAQSPIALHLLKVLTLQVRRQVMLWSL